MNKSKSLIISAIIALFWVSYRTNQYFEDKISANQIQVLGSSTEKRFFLPLPVDAEQISKSEEARTTDLILKSNKNSRELKDFYKEILRSKGYENDYEYEKDNISEIRYLNDKEDLKITFTQEGDSSIVEFNYHY
jgi:hypothetical protein